MANKTDQSFHCSFCGKAQKQVRKMISGPAGIYICDECIELCAELVDEDIEKDEAFDEIGENDRIFRETLTLLKCICKMINKYIPRNREEKRNERTALFGLYADHFSAFL